MLRTATFILSLMLALSLSFLASAQVTFTDVTASAGTNLGEGTSRGICWIDFNSDGRLDLFVPTSGSSANRLFMNLGNGTFVDVATAVGLDDMTNTYCGSWADMDNDGDLDLVTPGSGTTRLWRNNRQGGTDTTFTSIEGSAGISTSGAQMTLWADYNNDGLVDLYSPISNSSSSPDALYRNNGDGTFTNMADSAGVNHQLSGVLEQAVHWGDYNKDRYPDLFIGNLQSTGPSYFHRNNGNGTFTEVASLLGFQGGGRGGQWVDYNNDRLWDFSQARYLGATVTTQIGLFRNNGDGTFTNVATASGITDGLIIWSLTWADFDNNGFEDVFVSASGQSTTCQLYKNDGNGSFTNVTTQAGLSGLVMLLAAWGDYNNDGNMDLFTAGAPSAGNHLFKNNGDSTKRWLKIDLVGTRSSRSAIGAQIDVKAGNLRMMREINTGIGWRPQNSLTAHFGLDTNRVVDSIVVRWPSGRTSLQRNVASNQKITITEPVTPHVSESDELPDRVRLFQNYPNPFNPSTLIRYAVARAEHVRITVFNALGEVMETLVDAQHSPGVYEITFSSSRLASGVYFYRMQTGRLVETRKLVVIK